MSNDLKSIHDFDFTMICNYFKLLERQGPGSPEVTQKAVSFINELSDEAKIADIGCGTGGQTMVLANYTKGQITGIDLFPDFIEFFNRNAANTHCENRVKGIVGSMDNLPFQNEEQIPEKGRIHRRNRSLLVYPGTPCRNRRLLARQLPGN